MPANYLAGLAPPFPLPKPPCQIPNAVVGMSNGLLLETRRNVCNFLEGLAPPQTSLSKAECSSRHVKWTSGALVMICFNSKYVFFGNKTERSLWVFDYLCGQVRFGHSFVCLRACVCACVCACVRVCACVCECCCNYNLPKQPKKSL